MSRDLKKNREESSFCVLHFLIFLIFSVTTSLLDLHLSLARSHLHRRQATLHLSLAPSNRRRSIPRPRRGRRERKSRRRAS